MRRHFLFRYHENIEERSIPLYIPQCSGNAALFFYTFTGLLANYLNQLKKEINTDRERVISLTSVFVRQKARRENMSNILMRS